MTTWSPSGWSVLLGADWKFSYWQGRGGPDFHLETQCREFRRDYQKVLRGQWVAHARGDAPIDPGWTPRTPTTYGKGGLWSALMLYAKKIAVQVTHANETAPVRPIGPSVVPTQVAKLIDRWPQKLATPNITTARDGTITIPAVAFSSKNRTAKLTVMKSFDAGQQLLHESGDEIVPESASFEYEVTVREEGDFYLTANFSTWHMDQDLLLTTNSSTQPLAVPVFYSVGFWNETQPVVVRLLQGKNVLRFMRLSGRELAIKEFFLFKTEPVVPTPPTNHTPAPSPPPVTQYIELSAGKTCESQGILPLTVQECTIACKYFGFKDTGSRSRPFFSGCFALESGEYKGNCNFNVNTSAVCCSADARALCLRK